MLVIRACIRSGSLLGLKSPRCMLYLRVRSSVAKYYLQNNMAKLQSRQQQLKDDARAVTSTTKKNIETIIEIPRTDARCKVRQLDRMMDLSLIRVRLILKQHLQVKKITARWILHVLTHDQKKSMITEPKKLLKMYPKYSKIWSDVTRVHYYDPKRKLSNRIQFTKNVSMSGS